MEFDGPGTQQQAISLQLFFFSSFCIWPDPKRTCKSFLNTSLVHNGEYQFWESTLFIFIRRKGAQVWADRHPAAWIETQIKNNYRTGQYAEIGNYKLAGTELYRYSVTVSGAALRLLLMVMLSTAGWGPAGCLCCAALLVRGSEISGYDGTD